MKKKTTQYTTIPVEDQTGLDLKKTSSISHLRGEDGFIDYKLDGEDWKVIKHILSKSIYTKPEAAIREIFNNALRQCRTAKKDFGAEPYINIIFDVKNTRIIIEEIDSMGMPIQDFDDIYRHPSRSGNLVGTESGQFGIGKWAYLAISDTMVFETYVRKTNEKYGFLVQEKFLDIPDPDLKKFGTRVSLVINPDINFAALAHYASTLARFTQVKTFLKFTDSLTGEIEIDGYKENVSFGKGTKQIGPVEPKEFLLEKLESKSKFVNWLEFDKPDYHLLMAFNAGYKKDSVFTNLVGIPVSLGEDKRIPDPGYSGYILNIKDERKFSPVASRDQLKEDSFNQLREIIQKDLEEYFSKIDVRTVHDYKASNQKHFIDSLPSGGFDNSMPHTTQNFHRLLSKSVTIFNNEKKDKDQWPRPTLKDTILKNVHLLCTYNRTMKRIDKVLEYSSKVVVLVPEGNRHDRDNILWVMEQAGIQNLKEFMKEKGIKLPKNSAIGDVKVRFRSGIETIEIEDLTSNCIRISKDRLDDGIKEFCDVLNDSELEEFGMFRDQKKFVNTDSVTLDEFLRFTKKQVFETSEGNLTGLEILEGEYNSIVILRAHQSRFAEHLTFEFVKEHTEAGNPEGKIYPDLIIVESQTETKPTKAQALKLTSKFMPEIFTNEFIAVGNDLDNTIASILVEPLKIDVKGSWKKSPDMALKYLGAIKSSAIRELYALSYSKIFESGDGWKSPEKEDIQTCKELDEIFQQLQAHPNKNKLALAQVLFEKFQEVEYGTYQRNIREVAKEIVIEGLKAITNLKQRYIKVANLLFKDKVKNLEVKIKKDSYKDEITLCFETDKKIKIDDNVGSLFNKVSDSYYSLKGVSIDGNKVEVLIN